MKNVLELNAVFSSKIRRPKKNGFKKFCGDLIHYNTSALPRVWELDVFRGCLMILVTLDHVVNFGLMLGFFDFHTAMGQEVTAFLRELLDSSFRLGIQPYILFIFSFLSGTSCALTGNGNKRVVSMVALCAVFMAVFAVLHVLFPELVTSYFIFNIINVLTVSVIFWWFFDLIRLPDWVRLSIGLVLMTVGLTYFYSFTVRGTSNVENELLALLVYNSHGVQLVQNFEPLLPHMGFFLIGAVLGKALYKDKKTKTRSLVCRKVFLPLAQFGKNSLVYYFLLPEVVLGLLWLAEHFVWLFIG